MHTQAVSLSFLSGSIQVMVHFGESILQVTAIGWLGEWEASVGEHFG